MTQYKETLLLFEVFISKVWTENGGIIYRIYIYSYDTKSCIPTPSLYRVA